MNCTPPNVTTLESAARLYLTMKPPADVTALLVQKGATPDEAADLVASILEAQAKTQQGGKFAGRAAGGITPKCIRWLWQPWVPLGAMTLLYGEEGIGKGATAAHIAAQASRGSLDVEPCGVEWITFEDDPESVVVPRLIAAGADLDRITFHDESDAFASPLVLPDDVPALAAAMADRGSKLVVIDPLPDALREGLKDNNNGDVRTGLRPLQQMAKQLGVAVLGVAHPNKGATTAANKVMGSKAWRSVPRSVILFGQDPDNPEGDTRVMCVSKTNAAAKKTSVRVRIESADVADAGSQPRAVIAGESSYTDADLVTFSATGKLAGAGTAKPTTKAEQAQALLVSLLEGMGGQVDARTAYAAGVAEGISERWMREARAALKVESKGHVWRVPEDWQPPLSF